MRHDSRAPDTAALNALARAATLHCLMGCGTGEVAGMVIGSALGLGTWATVLLALALAFLIGYGLTMIPLRRSGMAWRAVLATGLAADTASISVMEIVDNALMLVIPGAMTAGLDDPVFWGSMALSLGLGGVAAFPVNRWLIARGRGHALVHGTHAHGGHAGHGH